MAHRLHTIYIAVLLLAVVVVPSFGESISLDLGSFVPVIEPAMGVAASGVGARRSVRQVRVPGCSSLVSSGDPALPCRLFYVALPPNADEHSVTVSLKNINIAEQSGDYDILPVPLAISSNGEAAWGGAKHISNGRNQAVYSADRFYPADHVRVRSIGALRGLRILEIEAWPCRYNPVSGKLRTLASGSISVDYSIDPAAPLSSTDVAAADMAGFVANAEQVRAQYLTSGQLTEPVADYAIITTSAIVSSSTKLAAFVAFRQSKGYKVKVVTESEWGGGSGDTAANNIRRWLRDNYLTLGLRYLLLIGDPNPSAGGVPMKLLWPRRHETSFKDAPSDYYYADLTGNWDLDGDGYFGEEPDDFGTGGIDRIPELYVGRIPFYGDTAALDSILQKTIDYEAGVLGDWSRNFLLPMKALDAETPSYQLGEEISRDLARPISMNPRRVYDLDYSLVPSPERIPCSITNVLSEWQTNGAGMVTWMSHGASTLASGVFSSDHCTLLDDGRPAIVFAASCDNGWPESSNNLGYSLLRQGAVCTQSASRASFYYPSDTYKNTDSIGGMAYEFARYLLEDEQTCGRAAYESRLNLPLTIWANHVVFNVYGDPVLCFNSSAFGVVSGKILTADGIAIPNAIIRTPDGRKQARSASDGSYRVSGLGVTTLELIATAPGYYSQHFYNLPISPGIAFSLDFHLQPATYGSIGGRIRDESGQPVAGAHISMRGTERAADSSTDGTFAISALEPGLYSFVVSKSPYAGQQISDCLVTEGQASVVDVTLHLHSGDLLTNGNFESGFLQSLAYGWQRYSVPAGYGGLLTGYDQHYDGSYSQRLTLIQPTMPDSRIGIFQTAPTLPGWPYTLSAWQRDYISNKETSPSDNVICRIGYDLSGGTDPSARSVVWREFDPTHVVWNNITSSVTATGQSATIFLEGIRKVASGGSTCYAWFDAVNLSGPQEAPGVPVVAVQDRYLYSGQPISVSWSDSALSGSVTYEYAVALSPDGVGIVAGGGWKSAGVGKSTSITGLSLANGALVYVLVRATDSDGMTSEIGASEAIRVVDAPSTISAAKRLRDGTWVRLQDVRVSRTGDLGQCFVQDAAGISGVELQGVPWRVPLTIPGTKASVAGCLATKADMRVITDAEVMPSVIGTAPRPLGLSNSHVGGGNYYYVAGPPVSGQKGSSWGRGLNTVGLLVVVWGRVRSPSSRSFIIDDGSLPHGLPITCLGSAHPPQGNPYVRVTGIVSPYGVSVCGENDIVVLQ